MRDAHEHRGTARTLPPRSRACITQGVIHRGFWGLLRRGGETNTSRGKKKESKQTTQGGMGRRGSRDNVAVLESGGLLTSALFFVSFYRGLPEPAAELLTGDTAYGTSGRRWMCGGNRDSGACTMLPEMQMATGAPLFPGESDIDQLFHIMRCFFGSLPERPMQHKNKRSSAQTNNVNFFFRGKILLSPDTRCRGIACHVG